MCIAERIYLIVLGHTHRFHRHEQHPSFIGLSTVLFLVLPFASEQADGRDGSCAYNSISQCLSGTQDYAAHLRLIAAVFCIERGWDGVHPSTKAYFAAHQVHQYGLPSTIDLAIEILSGECADLQALAMVGGVLDMSILHLHPGGVTAKGLEDVASWADVGKSNLDDFTAAEVNVHEGSGDGFPYRVVDFAFVPGLVCRAFFASSFLLASWCVYVRVSWVT